VSPCIPLRGKTRVRPIAHVVNSGTKLVGNQRVFLVTDNDEPAGSHTSLNQAQTTYNVGLSWVHLESRGFMD
jgi:stage III sporulation protein SpoIIIAA